MYYKYNEQKCWLIFDMKIEILTFDMFMNWFFFHQFDKS